MMRRFDSTRLRYQRTALDDRAFPNIGTQAPSPKARIKDESPDALLRALRAATQSNHLELERFIDRLNLGSRKEYACFLNVHLCAMQNLQGDWREDDLADFSGMSKCLQDDLQALGATRLKLQTVSREPLMYSNRLGVAYVIRNCRLAAKSQLSRVPKTLPTTFLALEPMLPWSTFVQQLEQGAQGSKATGDDDVVRGARITYELLVGILRQARN